MFDGRIYHGRTGAAGEGGHVSIDYRGPLCGCGKPGCIEAFAAGPAIAKRARAKLSAVDMQESVLLRLAHGECGNVTAEMVGEAYAQGDPVAAETLRETVELLSLWLGNMIDLLEPDVIILGGGVADLMRPFLGEIRDLTSRLLCKPALPGDSAASRFLRRRCRHRRRRGARSRSSFRESVGAGDGLTAFLETRWEALSRERHCPLFPKCETARTGRPATRDQSVIGSLLISPSTIRQIPKGLLSRNSSGSVDSGNPW